VLHLTEKGQTLVGEINGRRREHIRLALAKMDSESLAALRQGMAALAAAMKAGEPVPSK
jgi:DNA-binding MarR family transcriptional regulator